MVSSKRTSLAEDTVEDLLMIKLNLEKVENLERMEARGKRKLCVIVSLCHCIIVSLYHSVLFLVKSQCE